jgi:hypothetical protein
MLPAGGVTEKAMARFASTSAPQKTLFFDTSQGRPAGSRPATMPQKVFVVQRCGKS